MPAAASVNLSQYMNPVLIRLRTHRSRRLFGKALLQSANVAVT